MKEDNIDRLFSRLEPVSPSHDLAGRIIMAVSQERRRSLERRFRLKIALMGSGMALFGLSFLWAAHWLIDSLGGSGIYQFLSVLTADLGAVIPHVSDLLWAILESLPITSLMASLASALIILVLLSRMLLAFSRHQKESMRLNHESRIRTT